MLRALLGVRDLLVTVACRDRGLAGLAPAQGCQDPTPSQSASGRARRTRPRVHRIPLPTLVTIAKRPSHRRRDTLMISRISGKWKENFSGLELAASKPVESAGEIRFSSFHFPAAGAGGDDDNVHLSGKSVASRAPLPCVISGRRGRPPTTSARRAALSEVCPMCGSRRKAIFGAPPDLTMPPSCGFAETRRGQGPEDGPGGGIEETNELEDFGNDGRASARSHHWQRVPQFRDGRGCPRL